MDRNRDGRRSVSSMAASNGTPRRRHRPTPLPESKEEDGEMELQEMGRLRDQGSKRERDRGVLSRHRRISSNSNTRLVSREEGEKSTDDSIGDEDDYESEEGGVSIYRMLPPNATATTSTSTSSFSAISNQNYHHNRNKSMQPPPRVPRQGHPLKVADEMIGVSVPRKARSACVKRSYENFVAGNGSFEEEHNHRRASVSPASRNCEALSPSSSNVSVRKKMKPSGPKTRLPKVSESSTSEQKDIEIEIAEVLFGLQKHSQSSKEGSSENALQTFESQKTNGFTHDSKISYSATSTQTSILWQIKSSEPDSLLGVASKKPKVDVDSTQVQDSSVSSVVEDEDDRTAKLEAPELGSHDVDDACKASSESLEVWKEAIKQEDLKPRIEESSCSFVAKEKSASLDKESAACTSNTDVDLQDSVVAKMNPYVSAIDSQKEKFKIDLMAPPPMTSVEQDGIVTLSSLEQEPVTQDGQIKVKSMVIDEEQVDTLVKGDVVSEYDERIKTTAGKCESNDNSSKLQQKQQPKAINPKVETTARPWSMPVPIPVAGWPSGFPPFGYMPPFQTTTDRTNIPSLAVKNTHSQPRLKRCATHHYIALNIHMHQQFMKMNHIWQTPAGSATLCGGKPTNLSTVPSAGNMIIANPSFPMVNLNISHGKGQAMPNFPVLNTKNRNSEGGNCVERVQKKQVVLHQSAQPAADGNLLHGHAFIFPLNQHQANQTGPSIPPTSVNNASLPGNTVPGLAANASALPALATAVSFNYPNLATNEAPYLTILPNSGYPYPISTGVASTPAYRGGNSTQALPFYNGSFYPSQTLHASQLQQQSTHTHTMVQPLHQSTSTSSGSSSCRKQPQTQLAQTAQVSSNRFMPSMVVQSQQPQRHLPSHQSRKPENEMNGESAPAVADTRTSLSKKSVHGQNYIVPLQPNFTLMPPPAIGGGNGNPCDKKQQQQSQAKNFKSGGDLVPSQALALSFASFNGKNAVSNLSFSSMGHNPSILQSPPDMARNSYQFVSAPQSSNKKNAHSEGKTGGSSTNADDGKKASFGKPMGSGGQTLVFDNPARTLNFVSSTLTGNWPSQAISPTNAPMTANSSNSQQQQLLQLQKQLIVQQQPQHSAGASRSKALTTNDQPSSSIGAKVSHNGSLFSQIQTQSNSSPHNVQWQNSPRTSVAPNPSAHKRQGRASQGHSQISFGGNFKPASVSQGQQVPPSSHASSILVTGSPPRGGNLRTTSMNTKSNSSVPALQLPQGDNSSTANTQKSSLVCGRNVPSFLGTCSSHLSELKY